MADAMNNVMTAPGEIVYAALGDSLGVGVGARDGRGYAARLHERLHALHPAARLANLCISGATSRGVVDRQLPRAAAAAPAIATVLVGINDILQGVAPAAFGANVARIAEALAAQQTRALFCTVPDLAHAPAARSFLGQGRVQRSLVEAHIGAFNRAVSMQAAAHGHAVLDLFGVPLREPESFFSPDGFHPSAHGYEVLAAQIWPAFRQLADALAAR